MVIIHLESRGAVIPGLSIMGLPACAVRRAWAALASGDWRSAQLLERWVRMLEGEGRWRAHTRGGYRPVAVDVTGLWRPRLGNCPTRHYNGTAGKALPAIPVGIVARIGSVGTQRLALPLGFVRPDERDPSPSAHTRALVREAVRRSGADDVVVVDREFGVALLQEEGVVA